MPSHERLQWMREELEELRRKAGYRSLSPSVPDEEGFVVRDGKRMLNLASNHYLGLSLKLDAEGLSRLEEEAGAAGSRVRTGAAASRLIVGSDPLAEAFEAEFAAFKGAEASLLFGSGYMANLGAITALAGRRDLVFSDRLNHASIVDGITLSRAEHVRYRHRDMDHLEQLLKQADAKAGSASRRKLIVTDSVFSMDGSVAPLRELVELKERYGAMLMVDEAHSSGVYGAQGEGLVHALGLADRVEVQMGTFSKAYGCYGAYIAGAAVLKEYLINKARPFIYTTALPPLLVQCIRRNWALAREQGWRRERLRELAERFRLGLRERGFDTGASESQIVPLLVGSNEGALAFSRRLQAEGVAAVAIRPPTVPEGTARIRFSLMTIHQEEELDRTLDLLERIGREQGLLP